MVQVFNVTEFNIYFQGILEGSGNPERLPTILFVAHYDAMGVAPVSV